MLNLAFLTSHIKNSMRAALMKRKPNQGYLEHLYKTPIVLISYT